MNKSLELIKSEIHETENNLKKFTDLLKKEPENESHSFYVTYFTNRLTILQQIKTELEAWKELKKYIVLMEEQYPLYDTTYEYIELENGCIDESNTDEEGKSIMIIKKALELNYESEE